MAICASGEKSLQEVTNICCRRVHPVAKNYMKWSKKRMKIGHRRLLNTTEARNQLATTEVFKKKKKKIQVMAMWHVINGDIKKLMSSRSTWASTLHAVLWYQDDVFSFCCFCLVVSLWTCALTAVFAVILRCCCPIQSLVIHLFILAQYKSFAYILNFLTYFLPYIFTFLRIGHFRFQAGGCKSRSNLASVLLCLFCVIV